MDEARRFLRYVVPGLVYGVETLVLVLIADPGWTLDQLKTVSKDVVGVALTAFLASGALGYIFAALHHLFLWWIESDVFNHVELAKSRPELLGKTRSELLGGEPDKKELTREGAMVRAWTYWYGDSKRVAAVPEYGRDKLDSLGDQAHGLGAARVASAFALATALWICWKADKLAWNWGVFSMVILGALVLTAFQCGYRRVAKIAFQLWERIVWKSLDPMNPDSNPPGRV